MKDYDSFAIGLSKVWGISHGLNPVIYLNEIALTVTLEDLSSNLKNSNDAKENFYHLFCYLKPYMGINPKSKNNKDKVFYNEKEWRLSPYINKIEHPFLKQTYEKNDFSSEFNNELEKFDFFKLRFDSYNIKYIIVKNKDSKKKMLEYLLKFEKYNKALTNQNIRIITAWEIDNDF